MQMHVKGRDAGVPVFEGECRYRFLGLGFEFVKGRVFSGMKHTPFIIYYEILK